MGRVEIGKGVVMDDCLLGQQVDEIIAGKWIGVLTWIDRIRPGGKLGNGAGGADIQNAIAHQLHRLVNVAEKNAPEPRPPWQQRLMHQFAINYQPILIKPF